MSKVNVLLLILVIICSLALNVHSDVVESLKDQVAYVGDTTAVAYQAREGAAALLEKGGGVKVDQESESVTVGKDFLKSQGFESSKEADEYVTCIERYFKLAIKEEHDAKLKYAADQDNLYKDPEKDGNFIDDIFKPTEEAPKDDGGQDESPKEGTEAPKDGTEAPKDGTEAPKDDAEAPKEDPTKDELKDDGLKQEGEAPKDATFVDGGKRLRHLLDTEEAALADAKLAERKKEAEEKKLAAPLKELNEEYAIHNLHRQKTLSFAVPEECDVYLPEEREVSKNGKAEDIRRQFREKGSADTDLSEATKENEKKKKVVSPKLFQKAGHFKTSTFTKTDLLGSKNDKVARAKVQRTVKAKAAEKWGLEQIKYSENKILLTQFGSDAGSVVVSITSVNSVAREELENGYMFEEGGKRHLLQDSDLIEYDVAMSADSEDQLAILVDAAESDLGDFGEGESINIDITITVTTNEDDACQYLF